MSARGPRLTVDCIVADRRGQVLLIRRKYPPIRGGTGTAGRVLVEAGETVEDACRRELREETGLELGRLTLVGVYSEPGRDPRGPTVSIVYAARPRRLAARAGDDATDAIWVADWRTEPLAFDHGRILADWTRVTHLQEKG